MSKKKFEFVKIDSNYINYLKNFDSNVGYNQKELKKDNRPFIGVLIYVNNKKYYAPLSSANNNKKLKFDRMYQRYNKIGISPIDIFFIKDKDNKLLSVINLNNMIPVKENNIIRYDISTDVNSNLLYKEYKYCYKYIENIRERALKIYSMVSNHTNENLEKRCCNFKLLEKKCEEYNSAIENIE